MPYDSLISRSDVQALMPEEVTNEIFDAMEHESAVLALAQRLPNMSRAVLRMPVLSMLPQAYFVTSDTGLKQTTKMAWANKYIDAEELAVIVPIPKNAMDDSDYPIWPQVSPKIATAMGVAIDQAVLYGTGAPAGWPIALITQAGAAGNNVSLANFADVFDAVLGPGGLAGVVEEDGFMP